jgi:ATP-dependent DNA ligase
MITNGNEMFATSCKLGWERIISKNANAPYRSDRNEG